MAWVSEAYPCWSVGIVLNTLSVGGMGKRRRSQRRSLPVDTTPIPRATSLTPEQTGQFLTTLHLLIIGIWPAANPPPAVREALKRPELANMCVDFEKDLETSVIMVLRGFKATTHRSQGPA